MNEPDERFSLPDWVKNLPEIDDKFIIGGRCWGKSAKIMAGLIKQNADFRAKLETAENKTSQQQIVNISKHNQLAAEKLVVVGAKEYIRQTVAERDEARRQVEHLEFQVSECCMKIAEYEHQPLDGVKMWCDGLRSNYVELQAQVAMMRGALEKYNDLMCMSQMAAQYGGKFEDKLKFASRRDAIAAEMVRALDATSIEAAEQVQGLVYAALEVEKHLLTNVNPVSQEVINRFREALVKYRGEAK